MAYIPVSRLLDEDERYGLALEFVAGKKGQDRRITIPWIQKPGLALAGHVNHIEEGRVQFLGVSEIEYLRELPAAERKAILKKFLGLDIACIIVAEGARTPDALVKEARRTGVALLQCTIATPTFYDRIQRFLTDKLTQTTTLHGVLVDVFGVGTLIIGKSGIGKSECALDLVMRGHRLVADDVVGIRRRPPNIVYGFGSELIKYHMEIRGLGIINIKDLFGVAAIRDEKNIELVIELMAWDPQRAYDRLGIDEERFAVLGVEVPLIRIPVSPGRNITSIIEVAARNELLKLRGTFSAKRFQESLDDRLSRPPVPPIEEGLE